MAVQIIDEEIEGLEEKIRALRTRRNGLVLIAKLPPEIVSTIFKCAEAIEAQVGTFSYNKQWS
jgi:hypothetical protein